jgi:uncharacterized membrane protein
MKAWLKGGLWGIGIFVFLVVVLSLSIYFAPSGDSNGDYSIQIFFFLLSSTLLGASSMFDTPTLFQYISSGVSLFLAGSFIGWVVGKVKSQGKQNNLKKRNKNKK